MKRNYSVTVLIICVAGFFLTIFLLLKLDLIINNADYYSLFFNLAVVLLNLWMGITIIKKSLRKDNKKFLLQFFGSMIGRLFFLLIYVLVALTLLRLPVSSFILSFFGFYFFGLIFEINYLSFYTKLNFKSKLESDI